MRVAARLVAAFLCSAAFAALPAQRTLSFEERVNAQAAIERVYYAHQIGATKPFDQAVPRAVLENKVRKHLEQTAALQTYWRTAVTDETLQRELERMAEGTRMPERLQELYTALGNDGFLIKECLARPALVDRLTHNFYAFDPTMHVTAHAQAEAIRQLLASGELSPKADYPNRTVSDLVVGETEAGQPTPGLPLQQRVTQGELQKNRAKLPAGLGEVSEVKETREAFAFSVILSETATSLRVASYVVPKITWDSWWGTVELATLALNICRHRVEECDGIESQCGNNHTAGQSFHDADTLLANPSRTNAQCSAAKCETREVNNGHAIDLDTLHLDKEGANGVRMTWSAPYVDDGSVPASYTVSRRPAGANAPFTVMGTAPSTTFLDTTSGVAAWEYDVTAN